MSAEHELAVDPKFSRHRSRFGSIAPGSASAMESTSAVVPGTTSVGDGRGGLMPTQGDRAIIDLLLVGGVAAIAHHAVRPTADLDCLARRSGENLVSERHLTFSFGYNAER